MSLGLASQWRDIKKAYAAANRLCGDIIKVTPSSKVVGDLAQFMVQNHLSEQDVRDRAEHLNFPSSVVEFFQGYLGEPLGGFPEPLRSQITRGKGLVTGRPGASMPPLDFEEVRAKIHKEFSEEGVRHKPELATENVKDRDVLSSALYPKEYAEYRTFLRNYGDVSRLPTQAFITPMKPGDEVEIDIEQGGF